MLIKHLKAIGYLIIHDEFKSDREKRDIFKKYNLEVLNSFVLDENVWWDDYYGCLEKSIIKENEELFERDCLENDVERATRAGAMMANGFIHTALSPRKNSDREKKIKLGRT